MARVPDDDSRGDDAQAEPPERRDAFASYRARLEAVGFRPSTTRGQNFLLDPTLHRWIADQAGVGPEDTVVEIGVGLGFLTRELAARAGRVLAVEIEPRLLEIARQDLGERANVEWHEADGLGGPGRTLAPRIVEVARGQAAAGGRLLVVANLPYSVSGPMLAELVQLDGLADRVVVLVQKELAQRIVAGPGEPTYGGLSVLVQSVYRARLLRDVAPGVFRPRPKVVSAIVALDRRDDGHMVGCDAAARRRFATFVRHVFGQRRKVLRSALARAAAALGRPAAEDLPEELLRRRAEQLDEAELVALWRRLDVDDPPS